MKQAVLVNKNAVTSPAKARASTETTATLRLNEPDDVFEQEADRAAEDVMADRKIRADWSLSTMMLGSTVQRKCACGGSTSAGEECEECKEKKALQRQATGPVRTGAAPPIVHQVLRSPGRPLDGVTRSFFEVRFGYDFGSVRVHTDDRAAESARAASARAYTVGGHVVFGSGEYHPDSRQGRRLLAHELAHVLQQRRGAPVVRREPAPDADAMRQDFQNAVTAGQWEHAAEVLNGFNLTDIRNLLSGRPKEQIAAIYVGATNNPRVGPESNAAIVARPYFLDANYQENLRAGSWQEAARYLNGFSRDDIVARLRKLNTDQIQALHTGAVANPDVGDQSQVALLTGQNTAAPPKQTAQPVVATGGGADAGAPPATPPADNATRNRQLACVVRLGGCASSRDGGLPSTDDIQSYNRQCSADTHYAGPDIYPTNEECRNPPPEPLSTAEKIALGAFIVVVAALAVAAVVVVGAEVIPIAVAAIGEAGTAATAFYLSNAIAVNEIGLFAAGLVMACDGDVVGLLKAMADDPVQAAQVLAEVYILHVNIKVANGPARPATVPAELLPAEEQTETGRIKFKTTGPPTFEETEQAAPPPVTKGAAAQGTPGAVRGIGPSYATVEEIDSLVAEGKLRKDSHVLGVIVKDETGKIVGRWFEVSERGVGTKEDPLLGHTEQKALARISGMDLKPGSTVEFVGSLRPCNLPAGCSTRMTEFAQRTGIDVRYRYVYGDSGTTINDFTQKEGKITKGMREEWKH